MCNLHVSAAPRPGAANERNPSPMAVTEPVQKYFDALLASYDVLVDAVTKANERGTKLTEQFALDVVKGQREAIELGRKFAGDPSDVGQAYAAVLETATAAQGRALNFAQAAYQEALAAGTDARETVEKLVQVNSETTKAAVEAARAFASSNPWAEAMTRGFEAFTPAASARPASARKEKVTA